MLRRIVSTEVMPKPTAPKDKTAVSLYETKKTEDGFPYRVRANKRGVAVVPMTIELPEADFLHHYATAKKSGHTVPQRIVAILAQN